MERLKTLLLTACTPLIWGSTYITTTNFLPQGRPLFVGMMRALPIGMIFLLWTRQLPKGMWWWRVLVLGTLNIGIFFPLLFIGAYRLPGGIAATVGAVQPFIVAFWSWLLLRERQTLRVFVAAAFGIMGVAMMLISPHARFDPIGIAAALSATTIYACGIVLNKRWGRPVSLITYTAWQLVAGGLMLVPMTFLIEGGLPTLTTRNLLGFAYLGLIGTGLAYVNWFHGLDKLKPTTMSFLLLLSPVSATLIGWFALNQRLSWLQITGGLLVLASIIGSQVQTQRQRALVGQVFERR